MAATLTVSWCGSVIWPPRRKSSTMLERSGRSSFLVLGLPMLTNTHERSSHRPKAVAGIDTPKDGLKQIRVNAEALPGRGEDDLLKMFAMQVLDATKINQHSDTNATQRYNATIAALH